MPVKVNSEPRDTYTEAVFFTEPPLEGFLRLRTGPTGGQLRLTPEQAIELGAAMVKWGHEHRSGSEAEGASS